MVEQVYYCEKLDELFVFSTIKSLVGTDLYQPPTNQHYEFICELGINDPHDYNVFCECFECRKQI